MSSGTITGGGATPTSHVTGSVRGYKPSHSSFSGSSYSRGSSVTNDSMDFTSFITKPYDMTDYEEKTITGSLGIEGTAIDRRTWYEKLWDGAVSAGATLVVGATSVIAGAIDVVDDVLDGGAYVAAHVVSIWDPDTAKDIREWSTKELGDDWNNMLYGEHGVISGVNDASWMKYDSDAAQGIRSISKSATELAAATAATVLTGGGAAAVITPLAVGFLAGAGEKAEATYREKGTDISGYDEAGILLAGVGGAAEWYAKGKLGAGALKAWGAIKNVGIKNAISALTSATKGWFSKGPKYMLKSIGNLFKGTFNKTTLSRAASRSIRDIDNIFESVGIIADDVAKWVNGDEEFNIRTLSAAVGELGLTWVGNVTFDALADYFIKLKRVQDVPGMSTGQTKTLDSVFDYEKEVANGKYNADFQGYREHARGHTNAVRDYAVMLGLDIDTLDDKALAEIYYGAYFHDLGMAGGGVDANGMAFGMSYSKDTQEFVGWLDDMGASGGTARASHPLNSAVSILTMDVVPEGLDKDKIALLALSHSKSTSGVRAFADADQWLGAIDELEDAIGQYNLKNGLTGADAVTFDAQRLRDLVSDPNSAEFKQLVDQALCIRDGDALSDVVLDQYGRTVMQTGNVSEIDMPRYSYDEYVSLDKEMADMTDTVKTPDGQVVYVETGKIGKEYHAGEPNLNFDSTYDGHTYTARAEIVDPHVAPNSTIYNINERLGEAVTYTNCDRTFTLEMPSDMAHTTMGDMYVDQLRAEGGKAVKKAQASVVEAKTLLDAGQITQARYDQIVKNAQSVEDFFTNGVIVTGYGPIGYTIPTGGK